ncbi:hypothetical protein HBI18_174380 [Parastagonospora nodorum]|nr:hypothetical protein HBI06_036670 [Parastagonospora nodorum]KAH4238899.1 hypothetical protein HBI05_119650 [Parastagonospora nodorum]KAH5717764.1 hypothetical protein HBI18_174380 [Parastagonospora nodorum]KAH6204065.1 hypothetical protein HBI15_175340 [Parastagonospora nodorum]KAH6358702.1 hypothetical protein HBI37_002140 [Parastagonospora nodorum]
MKHQQAPVLIRLTQAREQNGRCAAVPPMPLQWTVGEEHFRMQRKTVSFVLRCWRQQKPAGTLPVEPLTMGVSPGNTPMEPSDDGPPWLSGLLSNAACVTWLAYMFQACLLGGLL